MKFFDWLQPKPTCTLPMRHSREGHVEALHRSAEAMSHEAAAFVHTITANWDNAAEANSRLPHSF